MPAAVLDCACVTGSVEDAALGGTAALGLCLNGDSSLSKSITNSLTTASTRPTRTGATRPNLNRQHGCSRDEPADTTVLPYTHP